MKKVIVIIAVLLSAAFISGFALPRFFEDNLLENTAYTELADGTYCISHTTEKGEIIECSFSIDEEKLSDKCYKYTFLFNQTNPDSKYNVYALSLNLNSTCNISISDAFVSEGGSNYKAVNPIGKTAEFTSDGNYMHVTMLVYKEGIDEPISAALRYSIKGNGLYAKNRFIGIEHNFTV